MEEEPRIKTLCPYCDRVIMFPPHWVGATMCCPDCRKEFTLTEEIQPPVFEKREYVKTMCQHCDGPLEYPADGIGTPVFCPHCGRKIAVGMPSEAKASPIDIEWLRHALHDKRGVVVVSTISGMAICVYMAVTNDDPADYQQHPLAVIFGSMLPALIIGAVWYYRVAGKKP
jgi:predicted amidophosphoribosyltransferase